MSRVRLQTLIDRSVRNMGAVHNVIRESTIEMIKRAYGEEINVQISSGFRSYADQTRIYNQGRTSPGNIVTNAKAGYSNHNFGVAIDYFLTSHDGSEAIWTVNAQWRRVAAIGKQLGFSWGGDWTSFKDFPHLQMTGGLSTAQMRAGQRPNLKMNFTPTKVEDVNTEIGGNRVMGDEPSILTPNGSVHIRAAQTFANSRDYPTRAKANFKTLVVDGFAGPLTNNALIRIYQYFANVTIDGKYGPRSKRAANTLRRGTASQWWVRLLQSSLNAKGYKLSIDGSFGTATENAVISFQRSRNINVDGVAGPNTWGQLFR
ncbi:peptidoglycan-binding protein [Alkalicoccobacillus murimartini]|uniref:Peptidoglycan L-alanyl-D-glutamate endopeptidase CwlK n=1 Tax=Alkalicoccobacillus murimartini TaxID=171685 RepID=A0ABT9YFM5_9BACI|nr:peptidoglycan-binding protein [Alkalicoccobacillus murimartini]MDQ0206658.1 peptidoglycan L-alanyl-D-glutamate endopeptidase CwlK [Alkalicoccobacillus murimartini]